MSAIDIFPQQLNRVQIVNLWNAYYKSWNVQIVQLKQQKAMEFASNCTIWYYYSQGSRYSLKTLKHFQGHLKSPWKS